MMFKTRVWRALKLIGVVLLIIAAMNRYDAGQYFMMACDLLISFIWLLDHPDTPGAS